MWHISANMQKLFSSRVPTWVCRLHQRSLHARCDPWLHGVLVSTPETFYRSVNSRVKAETGDVLAVSVCMHRAKKHVEQWKAVNASLQPAPTSGGESVWAAPLLLGGIAWATLDVLYLVPLIAVAAIVPSFFASATVIGVRGALQSEKAEKEDAEKRAVLSLTASPASMEALPVEDIAREWHRVWVQVSKEVDETPRQVDWDVLAKLIHVSSKDLKTFFGV